MKKQNTGILGIGAIGSVITNYLIDSQVIRLHLYSRTPRSFLKIKTPKDTFNHPITIHAQVVAPQNLDWLIICLKEHHYRTAQDWFPRLIQATTKIAIIRNGLELAEPLLPFCPPEHILECMIDCPTQLHVDGYYQQFRSATITCPIGPLVAPFQNLFINQNLTIQTVQDFKTASWLKLCESTAIGAITCLSGETCWIFQDKKMRELYQQIVAECITVAQADGAQIPNDFMDTLLKKLTTYAPDKGSSMLTDRQAGKPIELGAKSGLVVRLGAKYGVVTPLNKWVVNMLRWTNQKIA